MIKQQVQVEEFYREMGVRISEKPKLVNPGQTNLLIQEESQELQDAIDAGDFLAAIDALVDLVYVCHGAAVSWGIDLEPFFDEVHRTNMQKQKGSWDAETGRIHKPEGWESPRLAPILEQQEKDGYPAQFKAFEAEFQIQPWRAVESAFEIEELAVVVHDVWADYARETMTNPPAAFVKPWPEVGEWGREANRRTAKVLLGVFLKKLREVCYKEDNVEIQS